jgi:hypothetical protein
MKHGILALPLLLCLPIFAQSPRIDVGHLKKLSDAAVERAEVSLDGVALRWALGALKCEPDVYSLTKEIKGIYVNAFEFDADNQYSAEDIEKIRQQIKTPPWERMVSVKSKKSGEDIDVFILVDPKSEKIKGIVVLAVEKREIAIVNIVGNINLKGLTKMGGNFGLPEMELTEGGKGD